MFYWHEKKKNPKRHAVFFNGGPTFHSHYSNRPIKRAVKKSGMIDTEALRKKIIGDNRWVIFGQSFGGHVVHRYVTLYPQSVELAISHGYALSTDPLRRLTIRTLANYRAIEGYFTKHPDHRSYFEVLLKKFSDENFCLINQYKDELCGYAALEWIIEAVSFTSKWTDLADFFNAIEESSQYLDMAIYMKRFNDYADEPGIYSPRALWARSVLSYTDRNIIPATGENCEKVYTLLREEKGLNLSDLTKRNKIFTECSAPIQFQIFSKRAVYAKELFGSQRDILTMEAFKKGLQALGPNKFFLYSGGKDGYMPPEIFAEELTAVGHLLNYQNFNSSGHEGYASEPEILKKIF